jgi:small basic protein (TIGR04137 family)
MHPCYIIPSCEERPVAETRPPERYLADPDMSIDKSLRRKNTLGRTRSVLTRAERIEKLKELEKWTEGRSPFGLPKVRVQKIVLKKAKKEKTEDAADTKKGKGKK